MARAPSSETKPFRLAKPPQQPQSQKANVRGPPGSFHGLLRQPSDFRSAVLNQIDQLLHTAGCQSQQADSSVIRRVRPALTGFPVLVGDAVHPFVASSAHDWQLTGQIGITGRTAPGGSVQPGAPHSLLHVPVTEAADASGLLTTTLQLGQATLWP
jgi:hypothetical protein